MKNLLKSIIILIVTIGLFTSCGELSKRLDKKFNELSIKAEKLDSIVNTEFSRIMELDSLINLETEKVRALDSLVNDFQIIINSLTEEEIKSL